MNERKRSFLYTLLETPSPSGFETRGQRAWIEYVVEFADEVRTDEYGNAVAVHEGITDAPEIALTGTPTRSGSWCATPTEMGTDANVIFTQRGGIPSLNLGLPNRYIHTSVEVILSVSSPDTVGQKSVHLVSP